VAHGPLPLKKEEKYMPSSSPLSNQSQVSAGYGFLILLGRLFFSAIFIMSGAHHFASQTIAYAASKGVPMASILVPLSGVLAVLGGLSILLGYRARIGAWLIVLFLACLTPKMHNFWAITDPMLHQIQFAMFMKNLSMMGGALLITQFGSGPWSVDSRGR
jgi:putative oxidoreductase